MRTSPIRHRLRDGTGPLAEALRRSVNTPSLPADALEKIEQRITSAPALPLPSSRSVWLKLGGGGLAVAAAVGLWRASAHQNDAAPPLSAPAALSSLVAPAAMPEPSRMPEADEATPIEVAAVPVEPTRHRPSGRSRSIEPATPIIDPVLSAPEAAPEQTLEQESSLAAETQLLKAALEQLNLERNPATALHTLEAYEQRFPSGLLSREAAFTRIEALVAAGRTSDALEWVDLLQAKAASPLPRAGELSILRGELLAEQRRCKEALAALPQELPSGNLDERAFILRARCHADLGDTERSRAELNRYLEEYPQGRFAPQARAELEK